MGELRWDEIADRFGSAQNWWVATSGPAGPHSVPVWGVLADGALHFYGDPDAVRSRNLALDPRLVLHLESGSDVLLLHGTAAVGGPAHEDTAVAAAFRSKYTDPTDLEYLPDAEGMRGVLLCTVVPARAVAWRLDGSTEWDNRRWQAEG